MKGIKAVIIKHSSLVEMMSSLLAMALYGLISIVLNFIVISASREVTEEWSRKLLQNSEESNKRVHRSAFLDPNEVMHDQMHHMDHMTRENNNNNTNVQNEDPHDTAKQFCVDISEYLDLKWVIKESEECIVNFNRETFIRLYFIISILRTRGKAQPTN